MRDSLLPKPEKKWGAQAKVLLFLTILALFATCAVILDPLGKNVALSTISNNADNLLEVPVGESDYDLEYAAPLDGYWEEERVGVDVSKLTTNMNDAGKQGAYTAELKEQAKKSKNEAFATDGEEIKAKIIATFKAWKPAADTKGKVASPTWSSIFDVGKLSKMVANNPEAPERTTLMLWTGDWTYRDEFREKQKAYRLEKTVLGLAMGHWLGDSNYVCKDAAYDGFVGGIYDVMSTEFVKNALSSKCVVAVSKSIDAAEYKEKTFARQELKQLFANTKIEQIDIFFRNAKGEYESIDNPAHTFKKGAKDWTEAAVNEFIISKLPKTATPQPCPSANGNM